LERARAAEWLSKTGRVVSFITSQNSASLPWERSATTPSRAISARTRLPKAVSPVFESSAVDPPIGLDEDQERVR